MTYSILLTVPQPKKVNDYKVDNRHTEEYDALPRVLSEACKRNAGLRLLQDRAVLIPISHGLQGLLDVLKAVRSLPYTYSVLTEETEWCDGTNKD
jgi:hypothetical protein